MGNQKQKWTAEEEDALQRGVQKYGAGKWKNIIKDPEFGQKLATRSNIDLKDKWRNLNVSPGQGSKDKARVPKVKPLIHVPVPAAATPVDAQKQTPTPTQNDDNVKIHPNYNEMIFEALSTIKDTNGSDLSAIVNFIEQKHNLPQNPNFRRTLGSKLRRLVTQGKLEKVQNGYKIMGTGTPLETKSTDDSEPLAPKEMVSPVSPNTLTYDEAMREAAETVAYRIADAENKSFLAAEAVKEMERYMKLSEENDAMLKFAEELLERCKKGETFRFA